MGTVSKEQITPALVAGECGRIIPKETLDQLVGKADVLWGYGEAVFKNLQQKSGNAKEIIEAALVLSAEQLVTEGITHINILGKDHQTVDFVADKLSTAIIHRAVTLSRIDSLFGGFSFMKGPETPFG